MGTSESPSLRKTCRPCSAGSDIPTPWGTRPWVHPTSLTEWLLGFIAVFAVNNLRLRTKLLDWLLGGCHNIHNSVQNSTCWLYSELDRSCPDLVPPDLFLGLVREPLDYDALVLLVDSCRRMNMQKMRKPLGSTTMVSPRHWYCSDAYSVRNTSCECWQDKLVPLEV